MYFFSFISTLVKFPLKSTKSYCYLKETMSQCCNISSSLSYHFELQFKSYRLFLSASAPFHASLFLKLLEIWQLLLWILNVIVYYWWSRFNGCIIITESAFIIFIVEHDKVGGRLALGTETKLLWHLLYDCSSTHALNLEVNLITCDVKIINGRYRSSFFLAHFAIDTLHWCRYEWLLGCWCLWNRIKDQLVQIGFGWMFIHPITPYF